MSDHIPSYFLSEFSYEARDGVSLYIFQGGGFHVFHFLQTFSAQSIQICASYVKKHTRYTNPEPKKLLQEKMSDHFPSYFLREFPYEARDGVSLYIFKGGRSNVFKFCKLFPPKAFRFVLVRSKNIPDTQTQNKKYY